MVKRIISRITNNIVLKLLAVVFAIALWLVVINTDDPKITRRFVSSVTLENSSYLVDQNKYFELAEGSNTVTFDVTAKRSYMEQLSSTDFKVVANLKNTEMSSDSNVATVPIEITPQRYASQISVSGYAKKIQLVIDELQKSQFIVNPQIIGELSEGKVFGSVSATPNLVTISGPQSVISQIDSVNAAVDVSNLTSDVTVACIPIACDAEGNAVDVSKASYNVSTVTVGVSVLDTKNVGIVGSYIGEPAEGYSLKEIRFSPETVRIKGKTIALNTITSINIPANALDITSARGDVTQVVDVSEYLPSSVTMVDDGRVTVTAVIDEQISRTLNLYTSNIAVLNVPDGYKTQFRDSMIQVKLTGQEDDISKLVSSELVGTVDATDFQTGENRARVLLDLASGVTYEDIYMSVSLVKDTDEDDDGEADPNGQETGETGENDVTEGEQETGTEGGEPSDITESDGETPDGNDSQSETGESNDSGMDTGSDTGTDTGIGSEGNEVISQPIEDTETGETNNENNTTEGAAVS